MTSPVGFVTEGSPGVFHLEEGRQQEGGALERTATEVSTNGLFSQAVKVSVAAVKLLESMLGNGRDGAGLAKGLSELVSSEDSLSEDSLSGRLQEIAEEVSAESLLDAVQATPQVI